MNDREQKYKQKFDISNIGETSLVGNSSWNVGCEYY